MRYYNTDMSDKPYQKWGKQQFSEVNDIMIRNISEEQIIF